jgi:hypothetical protein
MGKVKKLRPWGSAPNPAGDFIPRPLLKGGECNAYDIGMGFLTKGTGYFFS